MKFERICFDLESKDPYLKLWGSGWATNTAFMVGAGIQCLETKEKIWLDDKDAICEYVDRCTTIVAHNAQYDCGFMKMYGVDLSKKTIIDTKLMCAMNCNLDLNYEYPKSGYPLSLMAKKYLNVRKTTQLLGKAVQDNNLYTTETGKRMRADEKKCIDWAYRNMDITYKYAPQLVAQYCLDDVECTIQLYEKFKYVFEDNDWEYVLSNNLKAFMEMTRIGVYIDMNVIKETRRSLMEKELEGIDTMSRMAKMSLNEEMVSTGAGSKVTEILNRFGLKIPRTAPSKRFPHGQLSVTSEWLNTQEHEFCKTLLDYRRYRTYRNNYCDMMVEYSKIFPKELKDNVLNMHPTYKIFGALPGRSSCSNPNTQQTPGEDKDKKFGYAIRSAFINPNGEIAEFDYKQQEFRLFADLIAKLKMPRIADKYRENPNVDFHELVAKIIYPNATPEEIKNTYRPIGKKINFGKLYGKGVASTCAELGVPEKEGKRIINFYDEQFPEVKKVNEALKYIGMTKGYITIDKRKVYVDPPKMVDGRRREYYYRLLNYYCQGRGVNQLYFAISKLYDIRIIPCMENHDAIGVFIKSLEEDKEKVLKIKEIMENCIDSSVDMLVDVGVGNNWAIAKSKEGKVNV